jgi:hypothetical protein
MEEMKEQKLLLVTGVLIDHLQASSHKYWWQKPDYTSYRVEARGVKESFDKCVTTESKIKSSRG